LGKKSKKDKTAGFPPELYLIIPCFFLVGIVTSRVVMVLSALKNLKDATEKKRSCHHLMIAIFNPFNTVNIETLTALIDVKQSESTFMDYAQAKKKIEDFKESEDKQMINYNQFDPHNMDCMSYFVPQVTYNAVEL